MCLQKIWVSESVWVWVCVFEQTTLREGSLNWFLWGEGQMFWCGQKKTSHHLWCENCSWADGLVKLSWFSLFFLQAKVPPHADLIENIITNRSNFLQFRFYVVTFHFLLFVTTIITPAWNNQLFKGTLAEQDTTWFAYFLYIHPSIYYFLLIQFRLPRGRFSCGRAKTFFMSRITCVPSAAEPQKMWLSEENRKKNTFIFL